MSSEKEQIKVKAICLFRNNNKILVSENYDIEKKDNYYRPLGGKVEFGEYTIETLRREIREELGCEIEDIKLETICENIFTCDGNKGHEVMYIYDARFIGNEIYKNNVLEVTESDGSKIMAFWKDINDFKNGQMRLVPEPLNRFLGI